MKKLINLKTLGYGLAMTAALVLTISYAGCKKKEEPPATTGGTGGGTGGGTTAVDYILFKGERIEMKNPAKGKIVLNADDTTLQWRGNQPTSIDGDTFLFISHGTFVRKAKTYTKFVDVPLNEGEISTSFQWGTSFGKPDVNITGGTYKLERVGGFWVSTLKDGTGKWDQGGGTIKNYTGIEFRATWPD